MKTGRASEYVDAVTISLHSCPCRSPSPGALEGLRRKSAQGGADYVGADVNTERQCQEGIARSVVTADSLMDKEDPGLGPHLSASSTSVIPVGTLRGGAKLYGEPFLYGGKVNTWYDFIRAKFHDFA